MNLVLATIDWVNEAVDETVEVAIIGDVGCCGGEGEKYGSF